MIVKRVGNPDGALTAEQFDGNFEDVDTRLTRVEGIIDQRISAVVGLDRVEAAENREAVNFVLTDGRVNGPFGYVPRMNPVAPWETGRELQMLDVFEHLGTAYLARVDHVAGDFDADRSAGKLIQLVPYSQNGFAIVGEYDPTTDYVAGNGVWYVPDPTTPERIEIWVAPRDIAAGVTPPTSPWVLSATNAVANLSEIQQALADLNAQVGDVVELANDASERASAAAAAVQAQTAAITALQAKIADLRFADIKDATRTNLANWASEIDSAIAELRQAVEELEPEEPEEPTDPVDPPTVAAADVTTTAPGVSVQAKLDDHESRIAGLQAAGGGSTGPVAADAFTVGDVALSSRLSYLDDQTSGLHSDIDAVEERLDDIEATLGEPVTVTAGSVTTDQGPSVQETLDELDIGIEQALDGPVAASRITSEHITQPDLNGWLYTATSQLDELASEAGPAARLDALMAQINSALAGTEQADLGVLLISVLGRLDVLEGAD